MCNRATVIQQSVYCGRIYSIHLDNISCLFSDSDNHSNWTTVIWFGKMDASTTWRASTPNTHRHGQQCWLQQAVVSQTGSSGLMTSAMRMERYWISWQERSGLNKKWSMIRRQRCSTVKPAKQKVREQTPQQHWAQLQKYHSANVILHYADLACAPRAVVVIRKLRREVFVVIIIVRTRGLLHMQQWAGGTT